MNLQSTHINFAQHFPRTLFICGICSIIGREAIMALFSRNVQLNSRWDKIKIVMATSIFSIYSTLRLHGYKMIVSNRLTLLIESIFMAFLIYEVIINLSHGESSIITIFTEENLKTKPEFKLFYLQSVTLSALIGAVALAMLEKMASSDLRINIGTLFQRLFVKGQT